MKSSAYTLRALSCLLRYPDAQLRQMLAELIEAISEEGVLSTSRIAELRMLAEGLGRRDGFDVEAEYVDTFDRGRATALHLFEHVHGDSRDRGPAMVDLIAMYEKAGLVLDSRQLPDHLAVLLEFASSQPPAVARSLLDEVAEIVASIFSALLARKSGYASVLAAVLELAGKKASAVPFEQDSALDDAWTEPEAFNGCSVRGQSRPGAEQPIHFVKRTPSEGVPA